MKLETWQAQPRYSSSKNYSNYNTLLFVEKIHPLGSRQTVCTDNIAPSTSGKNSHNLALARFFRTEGQNILSIIFIGWDVFTMIYRHSYTDTGGTRSPNFSGIELRLRLRTYLQLLSEISECWIEWDDVICTTYEDFLVHLPALSVSWSEPPYYDVTSGSLNEHSTENRTNSMYNAIS